MNVIDMLIEYIKEFLASGERELMLAGERYYRCENAIGLAQSETKLSHGFMNNMIDEKVQYLLGKAFTLDCKDAGYLSKVKETLGEDLLYDLQEVALEAGNKGIAWLQVYFDASGRLRHMLIPSEQCCPIWAGNIHHQELEGMLRIYDVETYERSRKTMVTHVEHYEKDGVTYYLYDGGKLILDSERYLNSAEDRGKMGHYTKGNRQLSFGVVPFLWCKNNRKELPDLKFVKSLIDDYDKNCSDVSQMLHDCKNWIASIRNYEGDAEKDDIIGMIKEKRRIFVDDDGGVEILTPKIDTQAAESHINRLKDDISLLGKSVARDKDKMGNSPSGIALKFLYSGLDLKCNNLEQEIKRMFRQLLHFLELALGYGTKETVEIIFNRDITINESDVITDCKNSLGIISDETIVANHPYVTDLEEELAKIKARKTQEDDGALAKAQAVLTKAGGTDDK